MSPIKNKNVPVREFYRKSSTNSKLLTLLSLHFIYRFLWLYLFVHCFGESLKSIYPFVLHELDALDL